MLGYSLFLLGAAASWPGRPVARRCTGPCGLGNSARPWRTKLHIIARNDMGEPPATGSLPGGVSRRKSAGRRAATRLLRARQRYARAITGPPRAGGGGGATRAVGGAY